MSNLTMKAHVLYAMPKRTLLPVEADALFHARIAAGDLGDYDTATLLEVLYAPENQPELTGFWLNFFDRTVNSTTQEIRFDSEDLNEYRLAPFVSPNVQGRVMRSRGYKTTSFRPAYVKPKHVVDPARTIPRRAGERLGGSMTLAERYDAIVADNLRRERRMIENRWDWMAARAIIDSSVTVVGEDYPAVTVDFGRDPSLTALLAGPAMWSASTATPMKDIETLRQQSFRISKSPVNKLIFGLDAWSAFLDPSHADVQKLLNALMRGTLSDFNQSGAQVGSAYEYQGTISGFQGAGRLDLYTYNDLYEDSTGALLPMMDQGTVVGLGTVLTGIRCFGAILDKRAGLQALDMFPKQWDEEDPSVSYTMTQSAPLMVPLRPNNSFVLKVV